MNEFAMLFAQNEWEYTTNMRVAHANSDMHFRNCHSYNVLTHTHNAHMDLIFSLDFSMCMPAHAHIIVFGGGGLTGVRVRHHL